MAAEIIQPLAVDGGTAVRGAPWPQDPEPEPATDPNPAGVLARELAAFLAVDPARMQLFPDLDRARVAALQLAAADLAGAVIVPALFADPWSEAADATGLIALPVDVDTETGALSGRSLAAALGADTRAIVVAHPFGHPASMTELLRLAESRSLAIVEDAAGALGAAEHGQPAGTLGRPGVLRLGVAAAAPAALCVTAGAPTAASRDDAALDEDAARAALAWLRAEPERLAARRRAAWELTFGLRGMRGIGAMHHGRWVRHAYDRYVVRLRTLLWKRPLAETIAALRAEGIPCEPAAAPPAPLVERARARLGDDPRVGADRFANAERLPNEWIAIPLAATLTQRDLDDVVAALRKLEAASS